MDGERFDRIARSLAASVSRRRALRGLAGGALAALLARLGVEGVAAACPCAPGEVCIRQACFRRCVPAGNCRGTGFPACGNNPGCVCGKTTAGARVCVLGGSCTTAQACAKTRDCPRGQACLNIAGCCPGKRFACHEPCPAN